MPEIDEYIYRKTMLYKTGVEYGDYTMNHVLGCSHGCKFPCYAYLMKKRFGVVNDYTEWCKPKLVKNTLELLDLEIPKLKQRIKSVQLCFSTDPFMYGYKEIEQISLRAIEKLNASHIKCTVLTKGILPYELTGMSKENEYGITIVSLDKENHDRFEPGAASYDERINALLKLHEAGFKTWVSMEPYPTPNIIDQDLQSILERISFVDRIIFGRTNYSKEVSSYKNHKHFYNQKASEIIEFCEKRGISYHIKEKTITKE